MEILQQHLKEFLITDFYNVLDRAGRMGGERGARGIIGRMIIRARTQELISNETRDLLIRSMRSLKPEEFLKIITHNEMSVALSMLAQSAGAAIDQEIESKGLSGYAADRTERTGVHRQDDRWNLSELRKLIRFLIQEVKK